MAVDHEPTEPDLEGGRIAARLHTGLMASVIGLALFASGTPSPLYGTYQEMWSLTPVLLTLVYATYAFGVLATLLLAGPVSDYVGRRPVLLGRAWLADGGDHHVHVGHVSGLAVRGARLAGTGDRARPGCGQCRPAGPAPAA